MNHNSFQRNVLTNLLTIISENADSHHKSDQMFICSWILGKNWLRDKNGKGTMGLSLGLVWGVRRRKRGDAKNMLFGGL